MNQTEIEQQKQKLYKELAEVSEIEKKAFGEYKDAKNRHGKLTIELVHLDWKLQDLEKEAEN